MRALAVLSAACLLAACSPYGLGPRAAASWGAIRIQAAPTPLYESGPARPRVGDFLYVGGLSLKTADSARFGGLSDLRITSKGELLAISDEGALLQARLRLDPAGDLVGLDHARIEPLIGRDLRPLRGKWEGDSEGLAVWPDGRRLVSFEQDSRIWLYPAGGQAPRPVPAPDVSTPPNMGMEALAAAPSKGPDAYWVGIEAGPIWLCRMQGGCQRWQGMPAPPGRDFRLKAMAETPSGDLVLLHHLYEEATGQNKVSISILGLSGDPAGAPRLKGRLWLQPPATVDNFEGVAVAPSPTGGLRLYLLSDDNFSARQRTLLMAFDWSPIASRGNDPG
jgi:hypothetical protein